MKRCRFGLGLLILLLILSIAVTAYMEKTHAPLAEAADRAALLALTGDWTGAEAEIRNLAQQWKSRWPATAAFSDHMPMETVNALLAQLHTAATVRSSGDFALLCARLSEALRAMGDAHSLTWWNLL